MTNKVASVIFMDYSIYNGDLFDLDFSNKILITTINQYSFCMAEEDSELKKVFLKADVLLPAGNGIVKAIQFKIGKKIKRIDGATIHAHLLDDLNKRGGCSCFYLGSSELSLQKIKKRLKVEYPNIRVAGYPPSFKDYFLKTENNQMIDTINAFVPDVLFVGMTTPQQEKWSHYHKFQLKTKIICVIDSVFDSYAGTVIKPSSFWNKLGLASFVGLLKEPQMLRNHYLYYWPIFIGHILQNKKSAALK